MDAVRPVALIQAEAAQAQDARTLPPAEAGATSGLRPLLGVMELATRRVVRTTHGQATQVPRAQIVPVVRVALVLTVHGVARVDPVRVSAVLVVLVLVRLVPVVQTVVVSAVSVVLVLVRLVPAVQTVVVNAVLRVVVNAAARTGAALTETVLPASSVLSVVSMRRTFPKRYWLLSSTRTPVGACALSPRTTPMMWRDTW